MVYSHPSPAVLSRLRLVIILVVALAASGVSHLGAATAGTATAARTAAAMGTVLRVETRASSREAALAATEAALRAVEEIEGWLSTWRPDSELSLVNGTPVGEWVELSTPLATALVEAFAWRDRTGGAFDPGLAPLVRAWGLRAGGRWPSGPELAAARAASGPAAFEVVGRRARRNHPDAGVEEGGFGKGLALRQAAAAALAAGATCVALDFGGQLHRAGACPQVEVEVAHPRDRPRPVATVRLTTGGLATSGNGERGMVVDARRIGHVLDPRSGRPAPFQGSISVFADDPLVADVLSTALFVLGPHAGLTWLDGPCWSALRVDPAPDGPRITVPTRLAASIRPATGGTLIVVDLDIHTTFPSGGPP